MRGRNLSIERGYGHEKLHHRLQHFAVCLLIFRLVFSEPETVIIGFKFTEKGKGCIGNHGADGLRFSKEIIRKIYALFLAFERGREK